MGLDDFAADSLSSEERERRNQLSQNDPPGDNSKWRHHEPGPPEWLPSVVSEKNELAGDSGSKQLIIMIQGEDTSAIESLDYFDLTEVR